MPKSDTRWPGWRGVSLVAVTYVYFLIFAQFAFLKRLADLGITDSHLKEVMSAMALGGILFSLVVPRTASYASPELRLRAALTVCASAAFLTLLPLALATSVAVSFLIGSGLGLLTITLVTHLRLWASEKDPLLSVGIGTGLGYFICNVPVFFTASALTQATIAGLLCLAGVLVTIPRTVTPTVTETNTRPRMSFGFSRVVISFTALVWLDSAAFFIIQNTPALKAGTWEGTVHLWGNGVIHFAAALGSVWLLRKRGLSLALSTAFLALAFACLLLLDPTRTLVASIFYPIGVSIYSVALVAYPSLLGPAVSASERGRHAGWIYAVAGWFGSAMGIGMGQNLGRVPPVFVLIAGILILSPGVFQLIQRRKREFAATVVFLLAAFCIEHAVTAEHPLLPPVSPIGRGRLVYISEGCINCHSQYVRPNTPDVLMWGPIKSLDELRLEHPPLIGNRRQGPDLTEVGGRRSNLWLKAHFYNPSEVSHASFMPSYAYLFRGGRGDDLVAYLHSLHSANVTQYSAQSVWRPSTEALNEADAKNGLALFTLYCSTCHAADGQTRAVWLKDFRRLPPILPTGPYRHLGGADSKTQQRNRLAQIAKFGLSDTNMPGHEFLSDQDIADIALWIRAHEMNIINGEKQ